MRKDTHCPMIHNGLHIRAMPSGELQLNNCCLMTSGFFQTDLKDDLWNLPGFQPIIETNKKNEWSEACDNCKSVEQAGHLSMRQGMLDRWGIEERLSGPRRIDIVFNISCNLACRICGSHSSTFWQKHLKENNLPIKPFAKNKSGTEAVELLKKLDLSHLQSIVFGGGETLMGNDHWEVCEYLATLPHAKDSLMISFQTNGTQSIPEKRFELLEKFHLVKLHISIDGIEERFNYQRWPGDWNQVENNLLTIKENAPSNVMFLIEETIGIFNLAYFGEVAEWKKKYFDTNREGDPVDHTHHTAFGLYSMAGCTQEYVNFARKSKHTNLIPSNWEEDPKLITTMLSEIKKFDSFRNQSFEKSLPRVAEFYKRYL
jgi:sulfatase maturation enzyme AslB (radical SAM superfamily)